MRVLIDTNILLYAVNDLSPSHGEAGDYLEQLRSAPIPWCLTWPIVYEFLRVATHRKAFARPLRTAEAKTFVDRLLASPTLTVLTPTPRHPEVLSQTLAELAVPPSGNIFHDLATAVTMREHGVGEIATADTDFLRFDFLKVINPLRGGQAS